MLDCRLLDLNTDRRQASSNLANPLVSSQNGKCGGHCCVDSPGGHFNGLLDSVQIGYRYPAAALRHAEHRSIFRYLFASILGWASATSTKEVERKKSLPLIRCFETLWRVGFECHKTYIQGHTEYGLH